MSYHREIRHVFASSENRNKNSYPAGNSYVLHLTTPIKDIEKVELIHASIPNTMYNLKDGSNVIGLSNIYTDNTGGTDDLTFFSIPPGFYSASGLATELQNAVNNTCAVSISYLSNEGKYLFSRPTTGNTFSMYITSNVVADLLGFNAANTNSLIDSVSVPYSSSNVLPLYSDNTRYRDKNFIKSDQVINMHPHEGIFLDIQELRTLFNEDAVSIPDNQELGFYSGKNISRSFGMIPMDVNSGEIKRFKKLSDYDYLIHYPQILNKIDRLTVRWTDKNGDLVNFNGLEDNSFMLRFHTLRRNFVQNKKK
jgi:hypothetical protein